jgi:hypothetical protein
VRQPCHKQGQQDDLLIERMIGVWPSECRAGLVKTKIFTAPWSQSGRAETSTLILITTSINSSTPCDKYMAVKHPLRPTMQQLQLKSVVVLTADERVLSCFSTNWKHQLDEIFINFQDDDTQNESKSHHRVLYIPLFVQTTRETVMVVGRLVNNEMKAFVVLARNATVGRRATPRCWTLVCRMLVGLGFRATINDIFRTIHFLFL